MPNAWARGYAPEDLQRAQHRYNLAFPPDLVALYLRKRPAEGYDWREDDAAIRRALAWPAEGLIFDVEHNALWLPQWGRRPTEPNARADIVRAAVARAPALIPLIAHRYLAAEPWEPGNPVFSIYQSDIIYYGADLGSYFNIELAGGKRVSGGEKRIRFWSDLVDRNNGIDGLILKSLDAGPGTSRTHDDAC